MKDLRLPSFFFMYCGDLNENDFHPWLINLKVNLVEGGIWRGGLVGGAESLGLGFDFKDPHHFQLVSCSLSHACGSDFNSQLLFKLYACLPAAMLSTMLVQDSTTLCNHDPQDTCFLLKVDFVIVFFFSQQWKSNWNMYPHFHLDFLCLAISLSPIVHYLFEPFCLLYYHSLLSFHLYSTILKNMSDKFTAILPCPTHF